MCSNLLIKQLNLVEHTSKLKDTPFVVVPRQPQGQPQRQRSAPLQKRVFALPMSVAVSLPRRSGKCSPMALHTASA